MATATASKWTVEFLAHQATLSDPLAESLIKEIALNQEFTNLRQVFIQLETNQGNGQFEGLPTAVKEYFTQNNELPSWADPNKIEIAQKVFAQYGPEISLILNYKALPICYSCKNGAKVLSSTGRLGSDASGTSKMMRRLLETSQMVINTMAPGGFSPTGNGIITVKKVRLYHAAIRFFLTDNKYNPAGWDTNYYGLPINQEEMAGTLMAFSALVINGLSKIGVELTDVEKDAYLHCWNIVGHFIGLNPELYPENYQQGWDLGIAIVKRNYEASADGKYLVASLIENSKQYFFTSPLISGIPQYLMAFFLEDVSQTIGINLIETLNIESAQTTLEKIGGKAFLTALNIANDIEDHSKIVRQLIAKYSIEQLQSLAKHYLHVNQVAFFIPDSLAQNWKMN